jgi:hypothetical protein
MGVGSVVMGVGSVVMGVGSVVMGVGSVVISSPVIYYIIIKKSLYIIDNYLSTQMASSSKILYGGLKNDDNQDIKKALNDMKDEYIKATKKHLRNFDILDKKLKKMKFY